MEISRRDALRLAATAAAGAALALLADRSLAATSSSTLASGSVLRAGSGIVSSDGRYGFSMQSDGNAVLRDRGAAVWATGTAGHPGASINMQTDGNLVLRAPGGAALWASGTAGRPGSRLTVQTDGNLVIYQNGNATWTFAHGRLTYPSYHPMSLASVGDARQMVVVVGDAVASTYSTVYTWQVDGAGTWREAFPAVRGRNGYNGWTYAGARAQGDGSSPAGTFHLYESYGFGGVLGGGLPYTRLTSSDYRAGDPSDPETYNVHQPSASATRTWRATDDYSERYADYPTQYEYLVDIAVYEPAPSTVSYDSAHGENVTSHPTSVGHGFAIYLHIDGAGDTAGCISLPRANLIQTLTWLDPAYAPRIAMAPAAWIDRV